MIKKKISYSRKKTIENKKLENLKFFLGAIFDKNRLRILYTLRFGEKCVCEIYKHLELPQNLTSYHLNVLEVSKIVSSEKRGSRVFYKINNKKLKEYLKLLNNFFCAK